MTAWVPILAVATPIVVAGLGTAGAVWAKRLSRRADEAAAHKTDVDAQAVEVTTARGLLEDVRKLYSEQRIEHREDMIRLKAELVSVEEKQRVTDHRLMVLIGQLALHRPWDTAAFAALTATNPDYPQPPPIEAFDQQWLDRRT